MSSIKHTRQRVVVYNSSGDVVGDIWRDGQDWTVGVPPFDDYIDPDKYGTGWDSFRSALIREWDIDPGSRLPDLPDQEQS